MASVKVDIISLFCAVASASSLSSAKVVAFIMATIEAMRAFCYFCDFKSLVQAWGRFWFHISGFTGSVRKPSTLPGHGYLSIGVWTLSSWSLSLRRPFRSFTSPSSTSFPVFSSMLRSCTISASSLLPTFISFITDLNMTAKFCASEQLGGPSPGPLVSFSTMLFCGLLLSWSTGTGFANLPTTLVWYSVFYGPIVFPTVLRNRANPVKKLRRSARDTSRVASTCAMSRACAVLSHEIS